jgi:hypothetical protein
MKYTNYTQWVKGVSNVREFLSVTERAFLTRLSIDGDYRTQLSHPSMEDLRRACGNEHLADRRTVNRTAHKIMDRGLIDVSELGKGRRSTQYRINIGDARFPHPKQKVGEFHFDNGASSRLTTVNSGAPERPATGTVVGHPPDRSGASATEKSTVVRHENFVVGRPDAHTSNTHQIPPPPLLPTNSTGDGGGTATCGGGPETPAGNENDCVELDDADPLTKAELYDDLCRAHATLCDEHPSKYSCPYGLPRKGLDEVWATFKSLRIHDSNGLGALLEAYRLWWWHRCTVDPRRRNAVALQCPLMFFADECREHHRKAMRLRMKQNSEASLGAVK